ncbi:MAG: hypothetical protein WAO58_03950 [Fimbriimonadaceae bacterium]
MKQMSGWRLSFVAALSLTTAGAFASEASELRAHIQGAMNRYVAAFKKHDLRVMESVFRANFSPGYQSIDIRGKKMNLNQTIQRDLEHNAGIKSIKRISLAVSGIRVRGNTASGRGAFMLDAMIANPKNPKKLSKLHIDSRWNLMLTKKKGKWWVTQDKSTRELATIDGKAMPPGM